MIKQLLFRRNKLIKIIRQSGQLCSGYENCPYPSSITSHKVNNAFKDEPPKYQFFKYCPYEKYIGPTDIPLNQMTRKEYDEMMIKNNLCFHPKEIKNINEWRCFKCNGNVRSARERHHCR